MKSDLFLNNTRQKIVEELKNTSPIEVEFFRLVTPDEPTGLFITAHLFETQNWSEFQSKKKQF